MKTDVQYYDVKINSSDLVASTSLEWLCFVLPFTIQVVKLLTLSILSCWVLDAGNVKISVGWLIVKFEMGKKKCERIKWWCALNSILMLVHRDIGSFFHCFTKHGDFLHLPAHPMTAAVLRSLIPGTYSLCYFQVASCC